VKSIADVFHRVHGKVRPLLGTHGDGKHVQRTRVAVISKGDHETDILRVLPAYSYRAAE
jgi:hypothetical protein